VPEYRSILKHVLGGTAFPARYAWFLEGRWRRWLLSPEKLAARLPLRPDSTVCEIGVGGGYYARALAPSVGRMIGIDLQAAMLRRVRAKTDAANLHVVQADVMALPLATHSVDIVVAVTVLGEVASKTKVIAEVARVLRTGGVFSVSEHMPDPDYQRFPRVRELCAAHGLQFVKRYGHALNYTANFINAKRDAVAMSYFRADGSTCGT
jgi:ubiquinone/menaquinone biosynthesis C-methylase UbiE